MMTDRKRTPNDYLKYEYKDYVVALRESFWEQLASEKNIVRPEMHSKHVWDDIDLMVVGEAPALEEERRGLPFVGMSGQLLRESLLNDLIKDGFTVYITNVVKNVLKDDRGNIRNPTDVEILKRLDMNLYEVDLMMPKVLLVLGRSAMIGLGAKLDMSVISIRGYRGRIEEKEKNGLKKHTTFLFTSVHPSAALRRRSTYGKMFKEDTALVNRVVRALRSDIRGVQ